MSELIQSSKVTALTKINDFVVKFANVNGSGSASANGIVREGRVSHGNTH